MAPNDRAVVEAVYATGLYNLSTHDGQAAFVDASVAALHAKDARWGHLKKSGAQTQIHGHAEDAALYLSDTPGQSQAVDFIAGAGSSGASVGWQSDTPRYSASDWFSPVGHVGSTPIPPVITPPPPQATQPPGREEAMDEMHWLDRYYASPEGLQRPNGLSLNGKPDFEGIAAWYLDVYQRERMAMKSRADSRAAYVAAIRRTDEWKQKHPGETP